MLLLFVLTCTEQGGTRISEEVKREITRGLIQCHDMDKGLAIACEFFDYQYCMKLDLRSKLVRCMSVVYYESLA